jgi:hypothetical protein
LQTTSDTPGIKILQNARFMFEGTNATALYCAYIALFTTSKDNFPDIHAAWQQSMHLTNEVHINILLKARGTNDAAFRINTCIMKMIQLSLCSKYLRDEDTLQLVQDILDNKQTNLSLKTDDVAIGNTMADTDEIYKVSSVTSGHVRRQFELLNNRDGGGARAFLAAAINPTKAAAAEAPDEAF